MGRGNVLDRYMFSFGYELLAATTCIGHLRGAFARVPKLFSVGRLVISLYLPGDEGSALNDNTRYAGLGR